MEIVNILIRHQVETNFESTFDKKHATVPGSPLYYAANMTNKELGIYFMNKLLELPTNISGVISSRPTSRFSAAHIVAQNGHISRLKILLNNGSPIDIRDNLLETPLHKGVEHVEIVKLLIEKQASLNVKNG